MDKLFSHSEELRMGFSAWQCSISFWIQQNMFAALSEQVTKYVGNIVWTGCRPPKSIMLQAYFVVHRFTTDHALSRKFFMISYRCCNNVWLHNQEWKEYMERRRHINIKVDNKILKLIFQTGIPYLLKYTERNHEAFLLYYIMFIYVYTSASNVGG